MAGRNLTNLPISASFQYLLQQSGSAINDGLGNDVTTLDVTVTNADNATQATSASFATNAVTASFATFASGAADTNAIYTASISDANVTFTKGDASTFAIEVNNVSSSISASHAATATSASHALIADSAISADSATTASYALEALTSSFASTAATASYVATANTASYVAGASVDGNVAGADLATTASYVAAASIDGTVANATNAQTASYVENAQTASFLPSTTNLAVASISASSANFTSASIGFLESITGSAKIIGDAYIILNNDTPTERYAGIVVQDSGSTQNTASFEFDGQTNDWFYEYTDDGGATAEFGAVMFGPGYNTRGAHVYPTNNAILKGTGDHHIVTSSMTDDGTLVTIGSNVSASGYVSASSFVGDGSALTGIAAGGIQLGDTATSLESKLTTNVASAQGAGDIAIGDGAVARGGNSVSLGKDANASSNDAQAIALGSEAEAGFSSLSVGYQAESSNFGLALGHYSYNQGGVTIGRSAQGNNSDIVALGGDARSDGNASIAIGAQARSDNDNGIAIGKLARATGSLNFVVAANGADLMTATTASQDLTLYGQLRGDGDELSITGSVLVTGSFAAGGTGHTLGTDNAAVGGAQLTTSGERAFAGGGFQNTISGTDAFGVGGYANTASGLRGGFFGGSGNTASHNYSVTVGGQNLTSSKADEVVVQHLTTKGQVVGGVGVISVSSQTGSMDCSTGNFFAITLGGGNDTRLEASNITAGQTINLKVNNNGVSAGTLSFSGDFEFVDGTAFEVTDSTSAVDIMTFISFDGSSLQATGLKNFS